MSYPIHVRSFVAGAAIGPYKIVKLSDFKTAVLAAAATDSLLGISDLNQTNNGDVVDVILIGEAEVVAGAAISVGDFVTSNANGSAITAAPAAGTSVNVIGRALMAANAGDIIPILLSHSTVHA